MLVHPWDASLGDAEWQSWIAEGHDFGLLSANGRPGHPPAAVPTHFAPDGPDLLIHLARPNPVWKAIEDDPNVLFTVFGDYAFIPGPWRAEAGTAPSDGVPTSYYTAVQFACRAHIIDDPEDKAELLRRQLAHFQPDDDHALVAVGRPPYGRMLPGIRGLRLEVTAPPPPSRSWSGNSPTAPGSPPTRPTPASTPGTPPTAPSAPTPAAPAPASTHSAAASPRRAPCRASTRPSTPTTPSPSATPCPPAPSTSTTSPATSSSTTRTAPNPSPHSANPTPSNTPGPARSSTPTPPAS